MDTPTDMPEEDRWLAGVPEEPGFFTPLNIPPPDTEHGCKVGEHNYVDLYGGWARDAKNPKLIRAWVFCKKCLDKKILTFPMRGMVDWDDDDR